MSFLELKQELISRPVPNYSKGEEIFNWVSHLVGIVVGFASLVLFITLGIINSYNTLTMASLIVYSFSMMFLYTCSMVYHLIPSHSAWKRIFRLIDHNTIYVLIAGTYAPICALAFPNTNLGIVMMSIEIVCLLIGSILNFVNFHGKFVKIFTVILYVVMGWLAAFAYPAIIIMPKETMIFVLSGGIAYTIGVIFYAIGKKKKWMHSVFHLFVLAGTIIQLFGVVSLLSQL